MYLSVPVALLPFVCPHESATKFLKCLKHSCQFDRSSHFRLALFNDGANVQLILVCVLLDRVTFA